jgi:hypothetical protein
MKGTQLMRNDSTPRIETRELADGELDNVSGGSIGVSAEGYGFTIDTSELTGAATTVLGTVKGLVGPAAGLLQTTGLGI